MNKPVTRISRRQQILVALAKMLQDSPGERITTSTLAKSVGVSEAALYRHFPSKTKMFEGLIEYIEDTVFSRIEIIIEEEKMLVNRCEQIVFSFLSFAERNPGMSRLLVGDALTGETERLRQRIVQIFEQVEFQLIRVLGDGIAQENIRIELSASALARLIMIYMDGCISQFVRSEFQRLPSAFWAAHWKVMSLQLLHQDVERV